MAVSFLLPLLAWCIAAYGPFWDVAYKVQVSAESPRLQSIFVVGNTLVADVWEEFVSSIKIDNEEILAARDAGEPLEVTSRQNKKTLRQIFPLALTNGWLDRSQETDDDAIRQVWQKLAAGELEYTKESLSKANGKIVVANAELLKSSGEEWPKEALLKLEPQASEQVARPVYLVPPHRVAISLWNGLTAEKPEVIEGDESQTETKTFLERYGESLRTIAYGFLLAVAVSVPLGILAGTYDFFAKLIEPFTDFFRYMPAPAFGVVLMAIFGLELGPKVMLVFLGTFPQAILMLSKTTRQLDVPLLEAAQTLGAGQKQLVTKVVVPGIMPSLYNDLRILLGWAWTWLVIAELMGFKSGLSEIIDTRGRRFQFEQVYPAILMIGMTGFITDQILAVMGKFLFPWMHTSPGFIARSINGIKGLIKDGSADAPSPAKALEAEAKPESVTTKPSEQLS